MKLGTSGLILSGILSVAQAEDKPLNVNTALVLIKPSGVDRGLVGEIIRRFESRGLSLDGLNMSVPDAELVKKHYAAHDGKYFFPRLVGGLANNPVVAMAWSGPNAITLIRKMIGSTDPQDAAPGTIRGDFGLRVDANLVHASDSEESAAFELGLWFPDFVGRVDHKVGGWQARQPGHCVSSPGSCSAPSERF